MNKQRSTESSEDYLEAILRIRSERGSCHNVDIACLLGYSKASVTKALAGLSAAGLAEVVARDVRLTPEGERIARRTLLNSSVKCLGLGPVEPEPPVRLG